MTACRTILAIVASMILIAGCAGQRAHLRDWPDGRPQERGSLDGYKPIGTWSNWHADGTLASEGAFSDGRQEGRWTYGHPGGEPAGVGHFRAGIQHGWWSTRGADGHVLAAGLMWQGRRSGPWILDGEVREYGGTPPVATVDSLRWQDPGRASVDWLVAAATLAVEARWEGPGSPWNERITETAARAGFAARLVAPPVAAAAEAAPTSAMLPEVDQPPPLAVEATPLPPLITYGSILRGFADSLRRGFTGALAQAAAAAPAPGPQPQLAGGDPSALRLIGRPLPQTSLLSSAGSLINLAAPARPTVLILMRGFSGSVCLYCASQTAALADAAATFAEAGIDIVVVFPGPVSSLSAFVNAVQQIRAEPPPLPIALDVNLLLVQGLGIEGELAKPTSLILGRDGRIAWAWIGTSMSDRPSAAVLLAAARAVR